ncbi:hypothetical protein SAMN05660690_2077 [Geodermatophilus telluris]|uniref:ABM domain-containing protein n=1 Tax=Geodermatophilus telluris TaxID=1190417 RepID=A0A1G6MWC9_9ACTN|nr:hypothetical protein [Geodermatophilus telluris]SDC59870.1 hypothetical protein SAMN05660690_2077 [Geodermatophilus telluris]
MTESALVAESMRNRHESLLHDAAVGRRDRAFARTARAAARRDGTALRWWRRRRPEPATLPAVPAVPAAVPAPARALAAEALLATPVLAGPASPDPLPLPTAAALTYALVVQQWGGITAGQYDDLRQAVGWDRDVPAGMRVHVASFTDGHLRTTDVWDSEEAFTAYQQAHVLPGLERLGIQARPEVAISSVYELTDTLPAPRRPAD